ncbi:MAG: L-seryl-tRNA(Sec) selenium transferase [Deltaproteobacteria bacterium]|nr:L-seryl-tRNA(Sec) selenium transferase [Deltaproteobacteria bacterium]
MPQRESSQLLRKIPKVDELLMAAEIKELLDVHPPEVVREGIRNGLQRLRQAILGAEKTEDITEESFSLSNLLPLFKEEIAKQVNPNLRRAINATGVVIHTNLGRSPLSERALREIEEAAKGYSNLEYDLIKGARGSRYVHVEEILLRLSKAEGGLVVNNNAGAVLLALNTLAVGREVIVSRGELVEIGGAFRIPDVMAKSGGTLREVGTTNKVHLKDYEEAISDKTGLLLKVHTSNYRVVGFTSEISLEELVQLGEKHNLPVMNDLGSGCLIDLSSYGMEKEPTVQEAIKTGVGVVTFSGDKLLGGPQAGIILGKKDLIDMIKANPLNRALRIDKLTLAALESTLIAYLSEAEAIKEIPTLRMLTIPLDELQKRAKRLQQLLAKETDGAAIEAIKTTSQVGGGALPLHDLPTWAVAVKPTTASLEALEAALRNQAPPIIARITDDRICLDLRTILADEFTLIVHGMAQALRKIST